MKRCTRCYMPDTRPGTSFEGGICQACLNYDKRKTVDWVERKRELGVLCDKYRKDDGSYDCVIPVSGGKDSYFLVHILTQEMGMHPLLVTVMDGFTHTNVGVHNLRNLIETFKLNHYLYTINYNLFKRATRIAFEETGEALKFIEYAIYTIPTRFAQRFGIPFVVYGENSAYEYGTTDKNFYLASPVVQAISNKLEDERSWWVDNGLKDDEVSSIQLDSPTPLPEVIYLSYFFPWSSTTNLEVARRYGFRDLSHEWIRDGCIENFEQIDSVAYMVHLWLKYPKFGFQRVSDIASRRVREGLLSLSDAKKLIVENDYKLDQRALWDFINVLGYTPKQFWDIVERLRVCYDD